MSERSKARVQRQPPTGRQAVGTPVWPRWKGGSTRGRTGRWVEEGGGLRPPVQSRAAGSPQGGRNQAAGFGRSRKSRQLGAGKQPGSNPREPQSSSRGAAFKPFISPVLPSLAHIGALTLHPITGANASLCPCLSGWLAGRESVDLRINDLLLFTVPLCFIIIFYISSCVVIKVLFKKVNHIQGDSCTDSDRGGR